MSRLAFIFIETQFDNLGDALINRELIRMMSQHAKVTAGISKVPESFQDMVGRDTLGQINLDRTSDRSYFLIKILLMAMLGKKCWLFLSPGGWIGEMDGRLNLRSWFHSLLYYALSGCGVRVCQLGVSYEDLGPKLSLLLSTRSRAIDYHFVRDCGSQKLMEALPVRIDGLCPDLAFNAYNNCSHAGNPEATTFSFRIDQYPEQIDDVKNFIAFFMTEYGLSRPIYFVSQVKKDTEANEKLAQWFEKRFGIQTAANIGSVSIFETEQLYQRSNIIVSNRLHSLLLAGSVGNAMIAAPIGPQNTKTISLFHDIGLANCVFSATDEASDQESVRNRLIKSQQHVYTGITEIQTLQTIFASVFHGSKDSE